MGVISPVGTGIEPFWSALSGGVSGIRRITGFDPEPYITKIAGEVPDFDPLRCLTKKEARHMDRFTQFAVSAADMAVEDAGLELEKEDKSRIGVILGSGIGGIATLVEQSNILIAKGPGRISPHFVPMMIANMGAAHVAIRFGLQGPNVTTVTACASSANAMGDAFRALQWGHADVVVSGGTEAPINPLCIAGFCAMKAMSTNNDEPEKASRPFDLKRDGFVQSEGAAVLVLETLEHALSRNARIHGEIIGYGCSCDAYHIVAPDPAGSGAINSMKAAIADAGINAHEVDYINAHATSTTPGDKAEVVAIKTLFPARALFFESKT
jgi:3-oxoacyl-[acyl-carrier-protein] synthase II